MDNLPCAETGMGQRPGCAPRPERGWSTREIQKMKNSGNEPKNYLKTKDITFFDAAKCTRFACIFAQIEH